MKRIRPKPLTQRLADICRCGHTLEKHDYGAAHEKPCAEPNCKCCQYHKRSPKAERESKAGTYEQASNS